MHVPTEVIAPRPGSQVEWYFQPARSRSIFVFRDTLIFIDDGRPHDSIVRSYDFPALYLAARRDMGEYTSLHLFYATLGSSEVRPSIHHLNPICLGRKAQALIEMGKLHPVDAYWNTTFQRYAVASIIDLDSKITESYSMRHASEYLRGTLSWETIGGAARGA